MAELFLARPKIDFGKPFDLHDNENDVFRTERMQKSI